MSDKFSPSDLRLLTAERTNFPATPQSLDPFFISPAAPPKFEPLLVLSEASSLLPFGSLDNSTTAAVAPPSAPFFRPTKVMDGEWSSYGTDMNGGSNGNSRWPRQETLTLLEIRSRLDSKFKESNQRGPLWDQVSRIMRDEYGYKRSGKKCKEKFDNLYKYYKKTKEGKTGRHDGKHYRFFRQLEAIYGECTDQLPNSDAGDLPPTGETHRENQTVGSRLSFSISSDFETSSSGNYHDDDLSAIAFMMNQKKKENQRERGQEQGRGKGWKKEVEILVDSKLSKLMETQETWVEKMLRSFENGEKERKMREEEWRKQEVARSEREMHEFCVRERAWLQAREAALMEVMKKFAGN